MTSGLYRALPSDLHLGDPRLDAQHASLFQLLSLANGRTLTSAELASTVKAMLLYALEHFTYEERLMADVAWPGLEAHRKLHEQFKTKCMGLSQLAMQPSGVSGHVVVQCLSNYLREQILDPVNGDLAFVKFVKANGTGAMSAITAKVPKK